MNTMVTFRTDEKLKNEASHIFDSLGMSLSTAINMFLKQTVIKKTFPLRRKIGSEMLCFMI